MPVKEDRQSFRALVGAQFLGAFNDNLFKQLMLFLAAGYLFQDRDVQGLAFAVFALPFVLFSGLAGENIDGIDIDTFDVSGTISQGDTAATLTFETGQDGWALIYIFLSFDTVPSTDTDEIPVGIITFGF